jgi:hypothetical protein
MNVSELLKALQQIREAPRQDHESGSDEDPLWHLSNNHEKLLLQIYQIGSSCNSSGERSRTAKRNTSD